MRRIALLNVAGGSCRTTSAVSLAGVMASTGRRTLLVDLDSGGQSSMWLGLDRDQGTLQAVVEDGAPLASAIRRTKVDGLDVAVGWFWSREVIPKPGHLRAEVESLEGYDIVLFDTSPTVNAVHPQTLSAAGEVIVPFQSSSHLRSHEATLELIQQAQKANPSLRFHGLLTCRHRAEEGLHEKLLERQPDVQGLLLHTIVPEDQGELDRALVARLPVEQNAPDTPAAFAYRQAALEILG